MGTCRALVLAFGSLGIVLFNTVHFSFAATELARVNNTVITVEDFDRKYKDNLKFFQAKPPTKVSVLEDIIKRELGIQEAKKEGLDKDPEIQDRINTVLYHALLERKISKEFENIHISDEQAKKYYSQNPEIRTSHIFVALRPNAKPEEQRKAYEKIKKIQTDFLPDSKMSFAEVAQRYSEGPSAPMGGDVDFQNRSRLDPAYYEAALKLGSPGKVSGIVKTQFGYHIIKLTGIRQWNEIDKAQVKRLVFEDERNKIFEKYMSTLKAQAKISTRTELIRE